MNRVRFLPVVLAALLLACGKARDKAPEAAAPANLDLAMPVRSEQPSSAGKPAAEPAASPAPIPAPIEQLSQKDPSGTAQQAASPDDVSGAARDGLAFALAFKAALKKPGNQFFSPYSVASALALLHLGARGATAQEIASGLRLSIPEDRLAAAMSGLQTQLLDQKGAELSAQSALWPSRRLVLAPAFVADARRFYGAAPEALDFSDPAGAAKRINDWVEKGTRGKIKDLISARMLTAETRLVLANAVYFKGAWLEAFTKARTEEQPFFTLGGTQAKAMLMRSTREAGYLEDGAVQVAELPYKGDRFSMVVVLPKDRRGLRAMEASLTPQKLEAWLSGLSRQEVVIFLPRFKLELGLDLKPVLEALGMRSVFEDAADFSKVSATEKIKVGAAVHKAFVVVNEEGTEAAAATAIMMAPGSAARHAPPPQFRADHPFLFLIRDRKTAAILFLGRFEDPT